MIEMRGAWAMYEPSYDAFCLRLKELELMFAASPVPVEIPTLSPGKIILTTKHPRTQTPHARDGRALVARTVGIHGTLLTTVPPQLKMFRDMGLIQVRGYDEIQQELDDIENDDEVDQAFLHVTSPGGMVTGCHDTADAIYALAQKKPVRACIVGMGCSAAYWLACQANEVYATADSAIGAVGVFNALCDMSKMFSDMGIKVHMYRSGELKGVGLRGTEISPAQDESLQREVDAYAAQFYGAVMRGRGMSELSAEIKTGDVWIGAAAQAMGLVDGIDTEKNASTWGEQGDETMAKDLKEETAAESRERLRALEAAFPAQAAREYWEKGLTAQDARDAHYPVLERELRETKAAREADAAKITALETQMAQLKVAVVGAGAAPVVNAERAPSGATASADADIAALLEADRPAEAALAMREKARKIVEAEHIPFTDAMSRVASGYAKYFKIPKTEEENVYCGRSRR